MSRVAFGGNEVTGVRRHHPAQVRCDAPRVLPSPHAARSGSVRGMTIHEHADAALHVLTLEGEVDMHHANELRAALTKIAEAKCPALLVDLSGVAYMDSAGLATLVEYMQRAMKFGGHLALGGVAARLRTIFDLARLGEIFAIHESVDAAKAALRA